MKRIIITLLSFLFLTSAYASMSDDDKKKTIECAGIYYANSMIPQAELELDKIVHSVASKKFLNSYLIEKGVNEEKLNKELLKIVDELYGKPYNEESVKKCDEFVYKKIPNSKDEVLRIVNSGIY